MFSGRNDVGAYFWAYFCIGTFYFYSFVDGPDEDHLNRKLGTLKSNKKLRPAFHASFLSRIHINIKHQRRYVQETFLSLYIYIYIYIYKRVAIVACIRPCFTYVIIINFLTYTRILIECIEFGSNKGMRHVIIYNSPVSHKNKNNRRQKKVTKQKNSSETSIVLLQYY